MYLNWVKFEHFRSFREAAISLVHPDQDFKTLDIPRHPCNSALKRDYFPVAGAHDLAGEDPRKLHAAEKPLLIYPIGDFDDDPEELIRFHGVSPYAVPKAGHRRHRALVTINFFHLDDPERGLIHDRNRLIVVLFMALSLLKGKPSAADKKIAQSIVSGAMLETTAHANCARSFKLLFDADFEAARQIANAAAEYVDGKS